MLKRLTDNLSNGFQDFPGLSVTGSVPLKQELINDTINEVLQNLAVGTTPGTATDAAAGGTGSQLQFQQLVGMLKKCSVSADAGVLTINFEIRR